MAIRKPVSRLSLVAVGLLTGCAASGASVEIVSQASGSPYFSLDRPGAYKAGNGLRVAGRVCRRSRTTLLSPPLVRLEHLAATGEVIEIARAAIPVIYRRADQACSNYSAHVGWKVAEAETVRACFDRGKACPIAGEVKAVIPVTAAPAP